MCHSLTYLNRHLPTYLQPRDPHGAITDENTQKHIGSPVPESTHALRHRGTRSMFHRNGSRCLISSGGVSRSIVERRTICRRLITATIVSRYILQQTQHDAHWSATVTEYGFFHRRWVALVCHHTWQTYVFSEWRLHNAMPRTIGPLGRKKDDG